MRKKAERDRAVLYRLWRRDEKRKRDRPSKTQRMSERKQEGRKKTARGKALQRCGQGRENGEE